jgi:hypothetical protein
MNKFYVYTAKLLLYFFRILNIKKKFTNKIQFNLGLNNIMISSQKYDCVKYISDSECRVYSQNGEDGIINYLITKLEIYKPNFIEIGVGNYIEANTRFLYERFYPKGIIMDCEKNLLNKVNLEVNTWKGDLRIIETLVNKDNINSLISKNCDFEIDIFSLDIDSIDYWVLEEVNLINSKIVIAEYNPIFGSTLEITVPNINNFNRKKYHYSHLCYGMSLLALVKLMKNKRYYFIGSNSTCNNAFFISENFSKNDYFSNLLIKDLNYYVDCNIRESRDINNKLNYLAGSKKIENIKECEVVNLSKTTMPIVKISDLI